MLATIGDTRLGIDGNSDGVIDHYEAEVLSQQDYYPFGMQMPGREYSSSSYRYGYNGMEKYDDLKTEGNSLDFGARIYDPRTARWYSLDPLQKKYPGETHYGFVSGNPIIYADADGRDKIFRVTYIGKDGKPHIYVSRDKDFFVYTKVDKPGFGNNKYYKNDLVIDFVIDHRNNTATYKQDLGGRKETYAADYYSNKAYEWATNTSRGSQSGGITLTSNFSSQADGPKTDATNGSDGSLNIDLITAAFSAVTKEIEPLKWEIEKLPEIVTLAKDLTEVSENLFTPTNSSNQKQKPVQVTETAPGKWDYYERRKDGSLDESRYKSGEAPVTKKGKSGNRDTIYTKVYSEPSAPKTDIPRKN